MDADPNNSRPRTRRSRKYHRNGNMKITIESNKTLLDILDDKRKVLKLLIIIVVLAMTIFIGLSFITVSIKSVYPYNSIRVNAFGTTTMQSEDKEIHYWLFNTAELWANSGIHVKEGDRLTIRSSGKFNTAIHHMINAAESNNYNYNWSGPEGSKVYDKRDEQRMDFRISKKIQANALIMQVVPDTSDVLSADLITNNSRNKNDIYCIGKECVDLIVQKEGNLHFAVNDIVLTRNIIDQMIEQNNDSIESAAKRKKLKMSDSTWTSLNKEFMDFGPAPGSGHYTISKECNEMTYYRDSSVKFHKKYRKSITDSIGTYYNAWFDDNVGSFLIVVEHTKSKP